jgi:exopolysaccharide biosynthesis polyprenyl glycosylphosphotransferase
MKSREMLFNIIRIIGDIIFINLAFYIAFKIKFMGPIPLKNINAYIQLIPYISIFSIILFTMYNLYNKQLKRRPEEIFYTFIPATFILVLFTGAVSYLTQNLAFPRSVYLLSLPSIFIVMVSWRYLAIAIERRLADKEDIIILAGGKAALKLIQNIDHSVHGSYNIKEVVVDDKSYLTELDEINFEVKEGFTDLKENLDKFEADIIALSSNLPQDIKELAFYTALEKNWEVTLMPEFYEIMLSGAELEQLGELPVFEILPKGKSVGHIFKRITDIFLSLIGIILSLPLTVPAALAVKIESRGPVFFSQERISRGDKKFEVYKFRTMVENAEEKTGPVLAQDNDSRITKVGNFLRKTRIDEIPQLLNVLKGDMSIVGPRPERPHFVDQFQEKLPHYKFRHQIKSGITGLAQVHGFYDTDAEDKLRMDLLYASRRSVMLDLKILLETLKVIFMRNKAK